MIQCHLYASLVSDILYSTLFLIHISASGNMCLLQHLYERRLKISHYSHCRAVWGRRVRPPDLLCQHRQGRFCFVYLSPQKHFRRKCHTSFIYTEVGIWGRALAKVGTVLCGMAFCAKLKYCIMSHDIKGYLHYDGLHWGCTKSKWTIGSTVGKFLYLLSFFSHLIVCFTRKAFQRVT